VAGPRVINPDGGLEDNARPFPSPITLLKKLVGNRAASLYPDDAVPDTPDWVAGMFMLFDSKAFAQVGGFDEGYFLYYEDADICARLSQAGWPIVYCKEAEVVHDARRDSHRKLRYLKWHLNSMMRFFRLSACRFLSGK
jgi:N-acetylglucosaminyl-diphospho-decaprenol L-rhamnosyltransferase